MKILFVCTHNRCRSILAEAIFNHLGEGLFEAASAGSEPAGKVHPQALDSLREIGVEVSGLHSKSWHDVESYEPDFVITVCDKAAQETCPVWFGKSLRVHWGLADPSAMVASDAEVRDGFRKLVGMLQGRALKLRNLMEEDPDRTRILDLLQSMGNNSSG